MLPTSRDAGAAVGRWEHHGNSLGETVRSIEDEHGNPVIPSDDSTNGGIT